MKKDNKITKRIDLRERRKLARDIYRYRLEHNISQEQLAQIIGTSVFTICRWEKGRYFPSQSMLKLMKMQGVL